MNHNLLNMGVHELELPIRLASMLQRKEIKTLGVLISYSEAELIGFGRKLNLEPSYVKLISVTLKNYGLKLREDT